MLPFLFTHPLIQPAFPEVKHLDILRTNKGDKHSLPLKVVGDKTEMMNRMTQVCSGDGGQELLVVIGGFQESSRKILGPRPVLRMEDSTMS